MVKILSIFIAEIWGIYAEPTALGPSWTSSDQVRFSVMSAAGSPLDRRILDENTLTPVLNTREAFGPDNLLSLWIAETKFLQGKSDKICIRMDLK